MKSEVFVQLALSTYGITSKYVVSVVLLRVVVLLTLVPLTIAVTTAGPPPLGLGLTTPKYRSGGWVAIVLEIV